MATNILIMIHGMTVDSVPLTHAAEYQLALQALDAQKPGLTQQFSGIIMVEWGHRPPATASSDLRPDQRIMDAENQIAACSTYNAASASNDPLNHTLGALSHPLAEIIAKITTPIKDRVEMFGVTDVFYYVSPDGETNVRATVYQQILRQLDPFRGDPHVCLHIFTHSLGNTVAHDFLYGLFAPDIVPGYYDQAELPADKEAFAFWRGRAQVGEVEVASFASMASQLPLMAMRKQSTVDILFHGGTLDPVVIGVRNDRVRWVLFYDLIDVFSFPTRSLYGGGNGIEEYEVDNGSNPATVHSLYTQNQQVTRRVADLFDANMC